VEFVEEAAFEVGAEGGIAGVLRDIVHLMGVGFEVVKFFATISNLGILPRAMSEEYPEQYLAAIRLFNEEDFFECHDLLEEIWAETRTDEKKFYQGLIQAAISLFHFGNENFGGARKLYDSSRKYLEPYLPEYMGIDLRKFMTDHQACFQELLDFPPGEYPSGIRIQDELVPKLHFVPSAD